MAVNQQAGGGVWNLLGTYSLVPGTANNITLTDQADGYVIADALRLVPVNVAPTVSLTSPAPNAVVPAPGNLTLTASAADADGSVAKVDFYAGTTLIGTATASPYTVSWSNVPAGTYSLSAQATDNAGAVATSAAVSVKVNAPPGVTLTAPADGASYAAPAGVTLTASASDTDGTIAKVEFYRGATLIATTTVAPYSYAWSGVGAGSYAITAVATDNDGAVATSAVSTITVTAAQAQMYFIETDQLNTPRLVADGSQATVWRWEQQEPFGADTPNEDPGSSGNPFGFNLRFPGQYFDRETNLAYNYFRDYDGNTGRYRESDPIGLRGGPNTYAYVRGNPLGYIDFNGLWCIPQDVADAISGTAGGLVGGYVGSGFNPGVAIASAAIGGIGGYFASGSGPEAATVFGAFTGFAATQRGGDGWPGVVGGIVGGAISGGLSTVAPQDSTENTSGNLLGGAVGGILGGLLKPKPGIAPLAGGVWGVLGGLAGGGTQDLVNQALKSHICNDCKGTK